jgi:hypothetical protein
MGSGEGSESRSLRASAVDEPFGKTQKMKKFLNRNPENCAILFAWFEGLFLFNFLSVPFAIFVFHWFMLVVMAEFVAFVFVFGFLAYQIEYHPLIAVIWSAGLFIPYASLIVILVLFV